MALIQRNYLFWGILFVKFVAIFLWGSDFLTKLFIPFVNFFVLNPHINPYDALSQLGISNAFPYSGGMLAILSLPRLLFNNFLSADWQGVSSLHLGVIRIPVLIADIAIYLILIRWLKLKERWVTIFYWASPILFYINYYHGQLDSIPIALLFLSLASIFSRKYLLGYLLLGVSLATKANILAAIPFIVFYILSKTRSVKQTLSLLLWTSSAYFIFTLPFLSAGFQKMVLLAEEQSRIFNFQITFPQFGVSVLVLPAIYLVILLSFIHYRRKTQDMLLIYLTLIFVTLVAFLPPMPGWFYWSIPFLAYFYSKYPNVSKTSFLTLNISYLGYFLSKPGSDIFSSWQVINPLIATWTSPSQYFSNLGLDASLVSNIFFTGMEISLLATAYTIYKVAIRNNLQYRLLNRSFMIGIAGDSGSGKTTLATLLSDLLSTANTLHLPGDDLHKWERGNVNWNQITHLNPRGNNLGLDIEQANHLYKGLPIYRSAYNHDTGKFDKPVKLDPRPFTIFEGLHPLFSSDMRNNLDLRIFMNPDEKLRMAWKIKRDTNHRGYSKSKVLKLMELRQKDKRLFIDNQKRFADLIVSFLPSGQNFNNLLLKIGLENHQPIDSFIYSIREHSRLALKHSYSKDLTFQYLVIQGRIDAMEVERIALNSLPDLSELLGHTPQWKGGYEGVCQLVFAFMLTQKMKRYSVRTDFYDPIF